MNNQIYEKLFYVEYSKNILYFIIFFIGVAILFQNDLMLYIFVILFLLLLFFFRGKFFSLGKFDLIPCENYVSSPAEGKIMKIYELNNLIGISIFLNLHNIHIQYFPCDGQVFGQIYTSGTFYPAYYFEKSKYNERLTTCINTKFGNIYIVQYAGQIAKKIISFHNSHRNQYIYHRGDPLGLIKFGSRVDLLVPNNIIKNILVHENENVWIQQPMIELYDDFL